MSIQQYNPSLSIIAQYDAATVVGLGITGFSAVRYLSARGFAVSVVDSRAEPPMINQLREQFPDVSVTLGNLDGIEDCSLLVVSPGVSPNEEELQTARHKGAHIVGDIELFVQENNKPIIAITGSNGKSTVTTLVGEMCEAGGLGALVAGNIGLPVLDALTDQMDYQIAVLELSSFQLETTSKMPAHSAAILNVSPDHMDRYASMGDYLLAKARIFRGAKVAVVPRHDNQISQLSISSKLLSFGLDEASDHKAYGLSRVSGISWLTKGDQKLLKLRDVPLLGMHNVKNVLAAFALVEFLDLQKEDLIRAVKKFKGLAHRMQTVCVHAEISWVNDSKATNIGATSTALQNLQQDIYWIAGGQGKGADFTELRSAIGDHIKLLILIGEDAPKISSALHDLVPIEHVRSMREAVELAGLRAQPGQVVLLSPACASFDMYQNFEQRGEDFSRLAQNFATRGAA